MKRTNTTLLLIALGQAITCQPQEIRIQVVEADHGRPVSNECLNISLGSWHGSDLVAPTSKDGLITLKLSIDQASLTPVRDKTCGGTASTRGVPIGDGQRSISVLPQFYTSCQYPEELTKNPNWLHNPMYQKVIPSFAIKDILANGVVATNTCTKLKLTPTPGELILVVRKITFMEWMRSG